MKTTIKKFTAGTFIVLILMAVYVKVNGATINALNIDSIETGVNVEKWIANEMLMTINTMKFANVVQESDLELEKWMFNYEFSEFENSFVEESDMDLELEDWMINDKSGFEDVVLEPALRVESWMLMTEYEE